MSQAEQLNTLQALFPSHGRSLLAKYLAASNYNVERAFAAVERNEAIVEAGGSRKRRRTKVDNEGLAAWVRKDKQATLGDVLVLSDSDDDEDPLPPARMTSKSAFDMLKSSKASATASQPAPTHVNLPPLSVSTPALVAKHTNGLVTLVENALPPELAARLYVKMVKESVGEGEGDRSWSQNKWYLVDREVTSPHTSCFYRELPEKLNAEAGYDAAGFDESAQYWYNGEKRTARAFTADQDEARQLIGEFVRTLLAGRDRHSLEWDSDWLPNVAVANCYRGSKQSVGFHSDVLQYLGPYPTIASLTLGCTRPFRLRPFIPSTQSITDGSAHPPPQIRTLDIILPHNSLLIMHAGCQERYKHAVPPINGMDVFRLPRGSLDTSEAFSKAEKDELERRKWNERINLTFRHYRADFAPRTSFSPSGYLGTPLCACGVPCTLRPDGRGRARASLARQQDKPAKSDQDEMVFFWVCNAGASNGGKGCNTWRLLDMEKERRGKWFAGRKKREARPFSLGEFAALGS
ncbi:ubiquitin system component Cue [Rhodotorula toruloides]|uniref:Ubiquitin system component Cue n=1 Tax=Rhodotorula toruloides TaxID=5286 RepID=A0A511KCH2_RHOTO|nr:ubiquitin system component Cue [Rhodotorula toruloides]